MMPEKLLEPEAELIRLRLIIARAGEKGSLGWWDSEALSDAGQFVLKRLFPRSYEWAAVQLALEAAWLRHRRLVGEDRSIVTLFALGDPAELAIAARIGRVRRSGLKPESLPPITSIEDLRNCLGVRGGVGEDEFEQAEFQRMLVLQGIELGRLTPNQLAESQSRLRIARSLAASYTLSEPANLAVPYFRLTGETVAG